MKLISLFATPLFVDYLDIDNQLLIDFAYEYKNKFSNRQENQGYQSYNLDLSDIRLTELKTALNQRTEEIKREYYSFKSEISLEISNSWFNINYPDGKCYGPGHPHLHPHRLLSCVYYPLANEKSGDIVLMSPFGLQEYAIPNQVKSSTNEMNANTWSVPPDVGKLLIFPGWMTHYVKDNLSNTDRVSFVLNYSISNLTTIVNTVY